MAQVATLAAPTNVAPGDEVEVEWRGPNGPGDFVAIAEPGAPASGFLSYARTQAGNPAHWTVPGPGAYEIRYVSGAELAILAQAPLTVGAVAKSFISAPEEILARAEMSVTVADPGDPADYVTIVPEGAADDAFGPYARIKGETRVTLAAPEGAGLYEIRHVQASGQTVLARARLTVTAPPVAETTTPEPADPVAPDAVTAAAPQRADLSQEAPRSSVTSPSAEVDLFALVAVDRGREFGVAWSGQTNSRDRITVVARGMERSAQNEWIAIGDGPSIRLTAPLEAGAYEILLIGSANGGVLARRELEVR